MQNAFISEKKHHFVNSFRNSAKHFKAKFLRFLAKKFAQIQSIYVNREGSHGKQGLKSVDIDPLPTMPLLQKTMNF